MMEVIKSWNRKRSGRAHGRGLAGEKSEVVSHAGLNSDDLEALGRGHSPWDDCNALP
jgi:hypothetical protein